MFKGPQKTVLKKVLIIAAALIVVQVLYIVIWGKPQESSIRDELAKIAERPESNARKMQLQIQVAVNDYMMNNKGEPPDSLSKLVPKYFDSVPVDPATDKPFAYRVEGKKFYVGTAGDKAGARAPGEGTPMPEQEKETLIALLEQREKLPKYVYNPQGKKDPFKPFDFSPDLETTDSKGPLERFDVTQWRFTAIIESGGEPMAMVEDPNGKGYSVKKGTKIGTRGGTIIDIQGDRLVVVETEVDFTGDSHEKTIDIPIKSAGPGGAGPKSPLR